MLLKCPKCGFCIDSDDASTDNCFYVKYKDKPKISRSSWSTYCAKCMKEYKKKYYEENAQKINALHREQRYQNYERSLEIEAQRRLAKSKNPDAILRRRTVSKLDPEARYIHNRVIHWKVSARKRGLEWGFPDDSFVIDLLKRQSYLCHYTKRRLVLGPNSPDTLSLDRVDSSKGYVQGNVVLCCSVVNKMKLDLSVDEFVTLIKELHNIMCNGPTQAT